MTQTIHRPDGTSTTPLVTDIPNLDTPAPYVRELASDDGHQRIELPSGHSAICLTSYEDVKTLMLDRTASRTLCNVDGGPSFMPTNWAPEVLINLDAPVHGVVREFVSHEFGARAIAGLEPTIIALTDAALDTLDAVADREARRQVADGAAARVVRVEDLLLVRGVAVPVLVRAAHRAAEDDDRAGRRLERHDLLEREHVLEAVAEVVRVADPVARFAEEFAERRLRRPERRED